jgi:hypothetical protein
MDSQASLVTLSGGTVTVGDSKMFINPYPTILFTPDQEFPFFESLANPPN